MLPIALSLLALAPPADQAPNASRPHIPPLALPTTQDYALVALPSEAEGAATVKVTRRSGSDQLDCAPTDIIGGARIAVASCKLIMMKAGWMAAVHRKDGTDMTVPIFRVLWEPAPASLTSDFGGTTPVEISGKAPAESSPRRNTDLISHYIARIDATGRAISCRITKSSGVRKHDETAFLVAMGETYLPALDEQGRPTETNVRSWVRFVDPG